MSEETHPTIARPLPTAYELLHRDIHITALEIHLLNSQPNTPRREILEKEVYQAQLQVDLDTMERSQPPETSKNRLRQKKLELYNLKQVEILDTVSSAPTNIYDNYLVPTFDAAQDLLYGEAHENIYLTYRFVRERVPNLYESVTGTISKSGIEAFGETTLEALGISTSILQSTHLTVTNFVRDFTKVPSGIISYLYGYQIGKTKYHYDEFLLLGTFTKPVCKVAVIGTISSINPLATEYGARFSNYFCETPSRFLTTVHRLYQDEFSAEERAKHSLMQKAEFLWANLTFQTILESAISAIVKTITTDLLGDYIGNKVHRVVGKDDKGRDIKEHIIVQFFVSRLPLFDAMPQSLQKFIMQSIKNFFATYALTTPARVIEDMPKIISKTELAKFVHKVVSFYGQELVKLVTGESETHEYTSPPKDHELIQFYISQLETKKAELDERETVLAEHGLTIPQAEEAEDNTNETICKTELEEAHLMFCPAPSCEIKGSAFTPNYNECMET